MDAPDRSRVATALEDGGARGHLGAPDELLAVGVVPGAEEVWRRAAQKKAIAYEVLDVGEPEGRSVVARLGLLISIIVTIGAVIILAVALDRFRRIRSKSSL